MNQEYIQRSKTGSLQIPVNRYFGCTHKLGGEFPDFPAVSILIAVDSYRAIDQTQIRSGS